LNQFSAVFAFWNYFGDLVDMAVVKLIRYVFAMPMEFGFKTRSGGKALGVTGEKLCACDGAL